MLQVSKSPWHGGELAIQQSLGVAEKMDTVGRNNLRDFLLDQHREFYPLLPFIVLGTVDPAGDAWATLRAGKPGFLSSPDTKTLSFDLGRDAKDPADIGMNDGDSIGALGIDLSTRRRNRLNGIIRRSGAREFSVDVVQSFGNCPKYIYNRNPEFTRDVDMPAAYPPLTSLSLNAHARAMIAQADTLFVASYVDAEDGTRQVDVSHRGGKPGFVRIDDDGTLTVPDFSGNRFFNTLGNILVNPRAGLVFPDFATGDLLQLTGDGKVILDSPEIAAFEGAERLLQFRPRRAVFRKEALPLRWTEGTGVSPYSLRTGDWNAAQRRLRDAALV